jgi:hypothetical protein
MLESLVDTNLQLIWRREPTNSDTMSEAVEMSGMG